MTIVTERSLGKMIGRSAGRVKTTSTGRPAATPKERDTMVLNQAFPSLNEVPTQVKNKDLVIIRRRQIVRNHDDGYPFVVAKTFQTIKDICAFA
jgi:hypothetical protein